MYELNQRRREFDVASPSALAGSQSEDAQEMVARPVQRTRRGRLKSSAALPNWTMRSTKISFGLALSRVVVYQATRTSAAMRVDDQIRNKQALIDMRP
jgi:hypothetical protein